MALTVVGAAAALVGETPATGLAGSVACDRDDLHQDVTMATRAEIEESSNGSRESSVRSPDGDRPAPGSDSEGEDDTRVDGSRRRGRISGVDHTKPNDPSGSRFAESAHDSGGVTFGRQDDGSERGSSWTTAEDDAGGSDTSATLGSAEPATASHSGPVDRSKVGSGSTVDAEGTEAAVDSEEKTAGRQLNGFHIESLPPTTSSGRESASGVGGRGNEEGREGSVGRSARKGEGEADEGDTGTVEDDYESDFGSQVRGEMRLLVNDVNSWMNAVWDLARVSSKDQSTSSV